MKNSFSFLQNSPNIISEMILSDCEIMILRFIQNNQDCTINKIHNDANININTLFKTLAYLQTIELIQTNENKPISHENIALINDFKFSLARNGIAYLDTIDRLEKVFQNESASAKKESRRSFAFSIVSLIIAAFSLVLDIIRILFCS